MEFDLDFSQLSFANDPDGISLSEIVSVLSKPISRAEAYKKMKAAALKQKAAPQSK